MSRSRSVKLDCDVERIRNRPRLRHFDVDRLHRRQRFERLRCDLRGHGLDQPMMLAGGHGPANTGDPVVVDRVLEFIGRPGRPQVAVGRNVDHQRLLDLVFERIDADRCFDLKPLQARAVPRRVGGNGGRSAIECVSHARVIAWIPSTASLLESSAMRAFVTGGSGFVGRNLIRALVNDGVEVAALARSEAAAATVGELGAAVVSGGLGDRPALEEGCRGADVVFHSAAWVKAWGDDQEAQEVNVNGTQRMLEAAVAAQVPRFVHVSSETVLNGGRPLVDADETWPYPDRHPGPYPRTKAESERRVLAAAKDGLHACVVRPRLIWGAGDTALLPLAIEAVRAGRFAWIDGGTRLTSHAHVKNVVHGLRLAAEKGRAGETYFVTDGPPHTYREFFTAQLGSRGVDPGNRVLPLWLAKLIANTTESTWRALGLRSNPPLNRTEVAVIGLQMTVNDGKARRELGYAPVVTWEQGLAELAAESASS